VRQLGLWFCSCLSLIACGGDINQPPEPLGDPPPPPDVSGIESLQIATFEGSGEVVHPDWAVTPPLRFPKRQQLVITPYPGGNILYELPSEYTGDDGVAWEIPEGATNPVARPTNGLGYLSDPDHLYNPDYRELWMYYRHVADGTNRILLKRTKDGVHWSTEREVVRAPNHALVSPSIVRRGATDWYMWTVNAGTEGCQGPSASIELRTSKDGLKWSSAKPVALTQPGFFPWHVEVQWVPGVNEFWALYNVKTELMCVTPAVYLATSKDGITWTTYQNPVLERGAIPEFADIVYRSTFYYSQSTDAVAFWFSGAAHNGSKYVWRSAVGLINRPALFAQMGSVNSALTASNVVRRWRVRTPALTNATSP
jgi:hypothetical protein